jgi:hypothetical protein
MPTEGTEKVLGGTRATRYPDPFVKGTANAYGLYPWSAFDALFVAGFKPEGGVIDATGIASGEEIPVLVFTSDIPVILRSTVTDDAKGLDRTTRGQNTLGCPFVVTTSGGSTAAAITNYGQVLRGYTGGALAVYVTGFPVLIRANTPDSGVEDSLVLQVIANSPVINGVVGPLSDYDNSIAPSPIIMPAGDYTQAIKDNGNIYQLNATSPKYQVVGIYEF